MWIDLLLPPVFVLFSFEQALGPGHPIVAGALNNLAMVMEDQSKFVEAEPLYRHALQAFMQVGWLICAFAPRWAVFAMVCSRFLRAVPCSNHDRPLGLNTPRLLPLQKTWEAAWSSNPNLRKQSKCFDWRLTSSVM